ncbi:MAG: hypothetical protein U9Q03_06190 [Patescibacteria group bacterium]|nr:hypothetical protein [Patescibacteria group bacterium]
MSKIEVKKTGGNEGRSFYSVTVIDGDSSTEHVVTVSGAELTGLVGEGVTGERFVEESFRFLLERESKESILGSFPISEILRYFPEYENDIAERCRVE